MDVLSHVYDQVTRHMLDQHKDQLTNALWLQAKIGLRTSITKKDLWTRMVASELFGSAVRRGRQSAAPSGIFPRIEFEVPLSDVVDASFHPRVAQEGFTSVETVDAGALCRYANTHTSRAANLATLTTVMSNAAARASGIPSADVLEVGTMMHHSAESLLSQEAQLQRLLERMGNESGSCRTS